MQRVWFVLLGVLWAGPHTLQPKDARYYPESIDSLSTSTRTRVAVAGVVTVVTLREDRAVTFRLRDPHGHSLACLWPVGKGDQPRVGAEIVVYGVRHAFVVPGRPTDGPHVEGQAVIEIDPVEKIEPIE